MRLSKKILQQILDSLPVHLYWTGKDTRIEGANISQAQNFGDKRVKDCIGKNTYDFAKQLNWDKKFADHIHKEHVNVIKSGKGSTNEYTGILADGKLYTYLSHKYPFVNSDVKARKYGAGQINI